MRIGLSLHPAGGADAIVDEARRADQQGFDSVWMNDHMMATLGGMYGRPSMAGSDRPPDYPLDGFTVMAVICGATKRTRLAWGMLNPSFRHPVLLAKMVATLDVLSHGRVICSVGAGFMKEEHLAYGAPFFDDHDERSAHQGEVLRLIKHLWTHPAPEVVDFEGKYVQAHGVQYAPVSFQKPHPPIWVGGDSDATMGLARDLADGWMMQNSKNIQERVVAADWPSRAITLATTTHIFVADTFELAEQQARSYHAEESMKVGPPLGTVEEFLARRPIGTPDDCLRKIGEIEATGISYLRVVCRDESHQEQVARRILPLVHK